ncbi:hypothetical protein ONE63_001857 [Megalurothrips usitatus]|uniref:Protein AF-10-like n=1 Tax=Megalurothrips usitatus TaxID=439358 RepID=A0AAV7X9M4_9NEOP|nr:hypothetical protein ONE63_001857 [Megalurothrips usitatus]
MKEMVGGCCVCSDERGWTENPLVYCDGPGCTVAVHQACYGIVTVPTGPWFCRKCESQERAVRVRCELCPIKDGALKRTDNQAWAHVVCALYIPEVRFGNVTTMEPIILQLVPAERFNKTCYICEEQGKGSRAVQGACMNCNKPGCKQQFHVTCAQGLGLLCEEAGNYMDNVKYCGYCQHHYSKLTFLKKKGGNVKQVPPYKPVPNDSPEEREESGRKRKSQGGKGRGRNATPSPNLNKQGGASPSPGSESGDHSRASTPAGSNGAATKELLPPPSGSGSVIKESKEKDKKDDKGKDAEKDKDKKDGKDVASSSISSTASTTSAKFTTSNFVETVVTPSESVFGADGSKAATGSSGSANTKKRRNAGGVRTPPSSTPSQDKDTKEKERDALGSSSAPAAPSPTSTPSTNNASVTKMEVDETPHSGSPDAVEKGVKKLKIVAEPNLSTLGSTPSNTDSGSKNFKCVLLWFQGPPNNVSSPGPVGSSVSSSANSIVVSVPLTAAVSLPNATSQQVSSAINTMTSGASSITSAASTTTVPADSHPPLITSSSSNSSSKSAASENLGKRSRSFSGEKSEKVEKQDKRKPKRGGQQQVGTSSAASGPSPSAPSPSPSPGSATPPPASCATPPVSAQLASPLPMPVLTAPISSTTSVFSNPSPISMSPSLTPAPILSPASSSSLPHSPLPSRRGRPGSSSMTTPPISALTPPVSTPTPPRISSSPLETKPFAVAPDNFSSSAISMKESPPSSPEPAPHRGRPKGRRGHSSSSSSTQNHKEDKEQKVFQNGVTSINAAPHMLGNQLNPSSSMAQKMSDTLTAELEAHAVFSSEPNLSNTTNLIGPQLPTKVLANVRASDNRSTPASGVIPQTLDQLLERQWEQGSQFLMEQAQHFDIASLLTCLHQLRSENTRLEEHIRKLQSRRDHLLAVNARLAIPLTHSQPPTPPHGTGTPSLRLPTGLSDGPGQSPGPLTPQGTPQGPSSGSGPVGAGGGVAQSSPQTPASAGHHSHPAATAGHPHLQHSQHSLAHPQSHLQGHQSVHSQGHSQGHPQGHPASHPASHPSSHSQGHPQSHSQGHSQAHSQAHSQGHSQGHPQSHSQSHSQGHPQSHSQGHPQSHSQGHPQSHSQGHAQSHSQGHSQSHSQGHTQAHSQGHSQGHPLGHGPGHPQGHSQGLPQGHPQALSQQSRQSSQRTPYGQPPLENGLPSESTSLHQGYGAHQRPQPSPNIRHTQSGSPYMMSQTPPASNPSVVRNSPVTSEQGRRGVGVPVPNPTQGYPMYPQGSAITMPVPVPPQQVVMHREADLLHASSSKHS